MISFFANTTQRSAIFFALPNFRKVGKFAASIECPKAKGVSASGGLRPLDRPTNSREEDSSDPIGWSLRFLRSLRSLRWLETRLYSTHAPC